MVVDNVDLSVLRSYDPDFSPPSTPDASDSESEHSLPSRPSTPPNPSIYALIHPAFFNPPRLPTDDFTWVCPVDDCHYRIAMLNLTEENCAKLDPDDAQRLKAGNWRFREIWVQGCFRWMVSCHFEDHLDKEGIVVGEDVSDRRYIEYVPSLINAGDTRRDDRNGNIPGIMRIPLGRPLALYNKGLGRIRSRRKATDWGILNS